MLRDKDMWNPMTVKVIDILMAVIIVDIWN